MKKITKACEECGISANVVTCLIKYGKPPFKLAFTTSTFHTDICDVCGEKRWVTEPRDFFYPDFTLLNIYTLSKVLESKIKHDMKDVEKEVYQGWQDE